MGDPEHRRPGAKERVADARDAASRRVTDARDAAAQRVADAKASASERVADARVAASEAVVDARDAAAQFIERQKPRLRGVSHQWAFFASLVAGAALIVAAPTPRATIAAAIYAVSLSALLGVSALYHRVNWVRPAVRRWMRRLDHSMIFLLIAGTATPFCLLVLSGTLAEALLIAVWAGAAAGIVVELVWVEAPKWVSVIVYLAVGWIGAIGYPAIILTAGIGAGILIALGGALYTAGAVVYARQRPDPRPATFGYHEIFHVLVIAAAIAHFAAIALYALPAG
ncbi:MAG TPA: hemolysin III family protein [Solirubrobacterales bacterium]|nr:hemolysin III family protein [Solirubrobacterales bacterium]HZB35019.1 hemolysin III family protein [Gaiellaceae bacterium]